MAALWQKGPRHEHLEEAHDEKRGARQDYDAHQSGAAS
jgi:hypothetical protein